MSIGKRLKDLRRNMKKTLKEESEIFNVSLNTIYRWEHDLVTPRKLVLLKIAAFYDVPLSWLIHGNSEEEKSNKYSDVSLDSGMNIEQKIIKKIRNLSDNCKYKVLGYIERICIEDIRENKRRKNLS